MGIKEQIATLKNNWLMVIIAIALLVFLSGGNVIEQGIYSVKSAGGTFSEGYAGTESLNYYPGPDSGFAPESEDRKVVKSSSLSIEIERGEFGNAEESLKNIVSSSGAYLLNERVNINGEGWKTYYSGYYSLKIETVKYDSVVAQLKGVGEVQSFNENVADVTGRYEDLEIEVEVERQRLLRYLEMFNETEEIEYKINLNDKIFDQERRIKYLENSLDNIDSKIEYSSISFSMSEERSEWTNVALVKFSDLIRDFVNNLNGLLGFIFGVIPWALAVFAGWFFWKKFRK